MTAARPIRFVHRGAIQSVSGLPPTTTVLQYLRDHAHQCGTKEGCAEGDCGACTVVVGELSADGEAVELRNVNACIQFLPMLDGQALLTVEDLGGSQDLHPVQQALVSCHASQCGFCTPGFAMTLQALYERHQGDGTRPSRQQLADDLSGNLCRCTGYRPLLDAGERMFDLPVRRLDRAPLVASLKTLATDAPLTFESPARDGPMQRVHAPQTIEALAALREALPQARLVAGATDVGLWVNKQHRDLGDIILVGRVAALRKITSENGVLRIGAAALLEDAWRALTAAVPELREVWLRFASPPVRHAGTLGGNIANGSPIGDGAPVLMALDAEVVLRKGARQRRMPLAAFYLDYMKNAMEAGEFLEAMEVPLSSGVAGCSAGEAGVAGVAGAAGAAGAASSSALRRLRAYKMSKRYDSDISALCAVMAVTVENGLVQQVRLAFGGMAAIVKRAAATETALLGQPWNEATVTAAAQALSKDFQPLTDLRASADYRLRVAANLLRRFWLETRDDAPLPPQAVSVWRMSSHGLVSAPLATAAPAPTAAGAGAGAGAATSPSGAQP
ncbi:xanthine dehydrogenase small subunit [Roseateles terrae]|uniref:Xanthine dehydrogenase small subunit n=1 Tax=Roseateles terrae TaxID=431060 RepID=A0ABR6GSQ4_9BURK|nr:xanthine dehydrogenase small subunit [Roseateles terrae]MBB3195085.1 xanthine dehydrogenase small subunit [Roseateles terrae]OWQ87117.1 xanthine dehydrogenase small subunit [Roseateles terrae]